MKRERNILKASAIVVLLSVVSKIFGFGRTVLIGSIYGASKEMDAFFLSQSMPNIIFPAIGNSLAAAFMTVYVDSIVNKGEYKSNHYLTSIMKSVTILSLILSVIGVIITPIIIPIFAPGFDDYQIKLTVHLTILNMSTFTFNVLTFLFISALDSNKLYFGAQVSGIGLNLIAILGTYILHKTGNANVYALTNIMILANFTQVSILYYLLRINTFYVKGTKILNEDFKNLIKLTIPIFIGSSLSHLNSLVDKILSSLLSPGSLSVLSYSENLNLFVTAIVVTLIASIFHPRLSESHINDSIEEFKKIIYRLFSVIVIFLIPISFITIFLSKEIVFIVYGRGAYDINSLEKTSTALKYYGGMYIFFGLQTLFARVFYSMKDMKTPLYSTVISVIVNAITSFVLIKYLDVGGIALGTSIATIVSSIIIIFQLNTKLEGINLRKYIILLLKSLISSIPSIIIINYIKDISNLRPIYTLLICTILGFTVYFVFLIILRTKEIINILNNNHK